MICSSSCQNFFKAAADDGFHFFVNHCQFLPGHGSSFYDRMNQKINMGTFCYHTAFLKGLISAIDGNRNNRNPSFGGKLKAAGFKFTYI